MWRYLDALLLKVRKAEETDDINEKKNIGQNILDNKKYMSDRRNSIVPIIGIIIIIILIGMVLFIGNNNEDKLAHPAQYVHYAYNVTGDNVTDLGFNNEMNATAEGGYAYAIGNDVAISENITIE